MLTRRTASTSLSHKERVIDINLQASFPTTKLVLPSASRSQVVNAKAERVWLDAWADCTSRRGLLSLSHALNAELLGQGVEDTAVMVGGMKRPFLVNRVPNLDHELLQEPESGARSMLFGINLPPESVIHKIKLLPMRETSWP